MTTTSLPTITVKNGMGIGWYDLYHGDIKIGTVHRKETRYNLRRLVVGVEWVLRLDGIPGDQGGRGSFKLRRDAVAAAARYLATGERPGW